MGLPLRLARLAGCLLIGLANTAARADYSISNNLTTTSGGVEQATGSSYLTAGFGSSAGGALSSVTLRISTTGVTSAELDIFNDDGINEPGTMIGRLTQVGTIGTSLANVTWTASGVTLAANTNYWVVLKALTGTANWSYAATTSGTGTGAGYQGTWGETDDAGKNWFTFSSYPTQMNVVLAGAATVPEPSSLALWGIAVVTAGAVGGRRLVRRAGPSPLV